MSCSPRVCCEGGRTPLPRGRKPILCYVTDRRGLEAASTLSRSSSDVSSSSQLRSLRESIARAIAAGVDWIQIREKDLDGRALAELVRFAVTEAGAAGTRVLVNDRLDIAIAAGAGGVHLGENSLPLEAAMEWRRAAPRSDFLVGVSCHSLLSARAAALGGADYVIFGPVFATPSKAAFGAPQGLERLREVCLAIEIPVIAIGGVNAANARKCVAAGAAGIAAIRFFQDAGTDAIATLRAIE